MDKLQIENIIRSTVHIVMSDPNTLLPRGIGSGCIIDYNNKEILLTVAHVTNIEAATCIITGQPAVNYQTPIYSVGAMNYLELFDMSKYEDQVEQLKNTSHKSEDVNFGLLDFSFATLQHKADFIQQKIDFKEFTINESKKKLVRTTLTARPLIENEYGFFGRIKPEFFKGTLYGDIFETQEVFHGGLKFIKQIHNYYEFELPNPIQNNADFKGTSGAPIIDTNGNLISLVTHGSEGSTKIYGIALAEFKAGVDGALLSES